MTKGNEGYTGEEGYEKYLGIAETEETETPVASPQQEQGREKPRMVPPGSITEYMEKKAKEKAQQEQARQAAIDELDKAA